MFLALADERLVEIYKQIVYPDGLVIAELLRRLRDKPYAKKVFAVTSIGRLSLTTAASYPESENSYSFCVGEKTDAGKTLITMSYHANGRRKPSAERQCPLEEAVEYIDLYVMRILLEQYGRL
jgi:hypothetical protein